jgi:hypothetical protein
MITRRLRFASWEYYHRLKRQAMVQESTAERLIRLANALHVEGRPEAARCLVRVALRFRVKAICLSAQADALDWREGLFV